MRDCPHCAEPIQDEATFCRHCHQEVEPPLWISSMRKCPFCAEWIDLENENCKYCGQYVGVVDIAEASAFVDSLLEEYEREDEEPQHQPPDSLPSSPFVGGEAASFGEELAGFGEERAGSGDEPVDFSQELADFDDPSGVFGEELGQLDDEPASFSSGLASLGDSAPAQDDEPALAHEAPFIRTEPSDFTQGLRRTLLEGEDEYQDEPESDRDRYAEPADEPEWGSDAGGRESRYSEYGDDEGDASRDSGAPGRLADRQVEPERYSDYGDEPQRTSDYGDEPERYSDYGDESEASSNDSEEPATYSGYGASPESPVQRTYQPRSVALQRGQASELAPEPMDDVQSSVWAAEVEGDANFGREQLVDSAPRRRLPIALLQGLMGIALIGGVGYGLVTLARGPIGAMVAESLATDAPTDTAVPLPTPTLRSAPTLPPEDGATTAAPTTPALVDSGECLLWDQITLEDEGRELCAYGEIRRWFSVAEVPFVAIFSEEAGTFAIVDRTTTPDVGPGDCIVARGTVEVMSRTRPDIDLNGTVELCPEGWLTGGG